ncbi:DnaJ C-terminal domain-containing protein [Tateyamaria sp. SN3-11]|uniref:DnaJ C-terminal domain-containing protein n=1 Tax=Tateyamaria sp. SN3-11 TaxID=3092147 RepID=UPI0039E7F0BD
MDFKDYYRILGVARDASTDDIKRSFRKNARKYHPDIDSSADAEAKFKDINEAYEVLKDPEKRAAYDQLGQDPHGGHGSFRPPPEWEGGFQFSDSAYTGDGAFSDFFETLFRRGPGGRADMYQGPGADTHAKLEISIEDAYHGASRTLSLHAPVLGPDGQVTVQDRTVTVHIPKGVSEGQHIRLAGQGAPSLGAGQGGDLFLEITFAAHPIYRPEGRDLYLELPIAPWEAALGAKVVMPTPGGKVDLQIPKNARTGQKLRLKGKGLPGPVAGDVYATLKIVNPKVTTAQARALFERMSQEIPFDPRAHLGG